MLLVTDPYGSGLDRQQAYWLYNGIDAIGTRQCFDVLFPQLEGPDLDYYNASFAFTSPCLAMTLRGTLVSERRRKEAIKQTEADEAIAIQRLNESEALGKVWNVRGKRQTGDKCSNSEHGRHLWRPLGAPAPDQICEHCGGPRLVGQPFNPHSSVQCAKLLYDFLGLKKRYNRKTGEVTTDDEALEALARKYPEHAALLDFILGARGLRKQLSTLKCRLDFDGRWRACFNVGATEVGRLSSSKSPHRTGANQQNIANKNRGIFIADPGLEFWYADLEQAESRVVAHDAQCPQDIADHNSGDTHTGLARDLFPELPWDLVETGGSCFLCAGAGCRACGGSGRLDHIAAKHVASIKLPWDEEHDYRHIAKIVRHGTNIGMSAGGIAREIHQNRKMGELLRDGYFARYPELYARQQFIRNAIRTQGALTNPFGWTRKFLGRLWEEDTQKEGLAQTQQSTIAIHLNLCMWRLWYDYDTRLNIGSPPSPSDPNRLWLLAQVHDALLGLRRPDDEGILCRIKQIFETPISIRGQSVVIPAEIMIGKSWRKEEMKVWHPKQT